MRLIIKMLYNLHLLTQLYRFLRIYQKISSKNTNKLILLNLTLLRPHYICFINKLLRSLRLTNSN